MADPRYGRTLKSPGFSVKGDLTRVTECCTDNNECHVNMMHSLPFCQANPSY